MTSIHINTSEAQSTASQLSGNLNQSQTTPSKYDEAERVRKKMDDLRKRHAESTETYNQSQPKLDEEIHDETVKYLKSTQINGTKTKSQKPRAPKRARTTSNATTTASSSNNISANTIPNLQQPGIVNNQSQTLASRQHVNVNHLPHTVHRHQPIPPVQHQQQQMQQQRHIQQQVPSQPQIIRQTALPPLQPAPTSYSPSHMQQPPMHMQQQSRPHQNQVSHQMYNGTYHSSQYQQQTMSYPQQHHSQHQAQQQQQQPQQQQHMQTLSHNQHMQPAIDQSVHYNGHTDYSQQVRYYQPQPVVNNHQQNHVIMNQPSYVNQDSDPTLPNDLDLNVQAGLDTILFDWDTLIKMSAESQQDFNKDLLHQLDNPYPAANQ